ncbi:nucleotide exchange factor GrpE [Candidatus Falkowbacteria bacterium CG11_big_fil_rev_8_21_14_0_20_39_10]|uniref:Protein GrpE n=1 Tax=Candidatus Falkowbacteria bacterium CG11_big_fil_rev_8_21_14_0_20_39_10 TaxID=1974570 RepID=A0A2M6K9P5_9BACT|nr:MAG: nucleotide exchange factor GrpE [Candidatus Falkowbacteria bacterium CG11_big_fil_rev_8_21_14_0_20_39_10]
MSNNIQKYPKATVGAFIFNEKDELFLMKTVQWQDKYACPGGKVELGETLEEAIKREVKEETNIDIKEVEFIGINDDYDVGDKYTKDDKHLIFIDYKAKLKGQPQIKLNNEATKYKWLKIEDWLKRKDLGKYTKERIEKISSENESFEHRYKRALADYQNLLKRTAQDKQEFARYANEQLILEIIPVYDNLKMSLEHAPVYAPTDIKSAFRQGEAFSSVKTSADRSAGKDKEAKENGWLEGIGHVVRQFEGALKNLGVEEIKTKGENFDHHTMEAIEGKGRKVKKEVRPGYKLNGKVIVPAKVIVG